MQPASSRSYDAVRSSARGTGSAPATACHFSERTQTPGTLEPHTVAAAARPATDHYGGARIFLRVSPNKC